MRRRSSSSSRFRFVIAPAAFLAIAIVAMGSTGACYSPTEVTVSISTDAPCTGLQTAIFKGDSDHIDTDPQTVTADCTQGAVGQDSTIGSIVFVPSGSKDGHAAVKAVVTRNGKQPSECTDQSPDNCIVATRSFQFVSHTSRKIPIRLLQACFGATCPTGYTCVGLGQCAPIDCPDDNCNLQPDPDAGFDAPPPVTVNEAGKDGPSVDPTALCGGPAGTELTSTSSEILITATTHAMYFTEVSGANGEAPGTLFSFAFLGALATTTGKQPVGQGLISPIALGVSGDTPLVLYGDAPNLHVRLGASDNSTDFPFASPSDVPTRLAGNPAIGALLGKILLAGSVSFSEISTPAGGPNAITPIALVPKSPPISSIALEGIQSATDDTFYYGGKDGLHHVIVSNGQAIDSAIPSSVKSAVLVSSVSAVQGLTSLQVVASGVPASGGGGAAATHRIELVNTASTTFITTYAGNDVIGVNDTNVFYVDQSIGMLMSSQIRGTRHDTAIVAVPDPVTHIFADATCVYYWSKHAKGGLSLYAAPVATGL